MANSKSQLNLYCQGHHLQTPIYTTEREGPEGYASTVLVCQQKFESDAVHSSKKLAEEDAARVALNSVKSQASGASSLRSGFQDRSAADYRNAVPDVEEPVASATCTHPVRTGLASWSVNGAKKKASADYSQKLEKLCKEHKLPAPRYNVEESADGKFSASIVVEGRGDYSSARESDSYGEAKEYAALIALAELGLSLLSISGGTENEEEEHVERSELVSNGEDATPAPPPPPTTSGAHDIQLPENNYKAILNEYCQKHYLALPEYTTEYPENSTGYIAVVTVCESEYRSTPHMAKKKAEQNAAGRAALELGLVKAEGREEGGGGGGGGGYRSPLGQSFTPRAAPDVESSLAANYKGTLQEFLARRGLGNPQYTTEQGYAGKFISTVTLTDPSGETLQFPGTGHANKKMAEQDAAKKACLHYSLAS